IIYTRCSCRQSDLIAFTVSTNTNELRLPAMGSFRRNRVLDCGEAALEVGVGATAPLGYRQQGKACEALDIVETFHGLDHSPPHQAEHRQDPERFFREMDCVHVDPGDVCTKAKEPIAPRLVARRQLTQCTKTLCRRTIEPRPVKGLSIRVRIAPEQNVVD